MIPALLGCGAISDRIGRRGIFVAGAILCGLWSFAFFPLIELGSAAGVILAIGLALVSSA